MFKKILSKKTAGLLAAGTIALSTVGGTAYAAYGSQWDTYIENGINKLYETIFPEIKQKTEEKERFIITQIPKDIKEYIASLNGKINEHKNELIERNEKELDKYYEETKSKAKETADKIVEKKTIEVEREADKELEEAIQNIDKKIEQELKTFSK